MSEQQTCGTCKHWYSDADQIQIEGRAICLMTTTAKGQNTGMTQRAEDSKATATAVVISSFGFRFVMGQLETTEAFGCNQWEAGA